MDGLISRGYVQAYCSIETSVVRGVAQGSILGPILILLFINNIQFYTKTDKLSIFVDDTSLTLSITGIEELKKLQIMRKITLNNGLIRILLV